MAKIQFALFLILAQSLSAAGADRIPLYWNPYEYNFVHDDFIPEGTWKSNVDWIADHFKGYGYDMIVTDGWIYGDTEVDADGYLTRYNNSWVHDFGYWRNYLDAKGLKLGIYYNPLWIQQSAYLKNGHVRGTGYTIQSISGPPRAPNSKYNKHWINPAQPGAKEYVQGYVRYFKSMGVKLLRLDFLSEFENIYGTPAYDQALGWVREAAGDDLFISLVMPNAYGHAATEIKYGDMMRVSEDSFQGGWAALSERNRGARFPEWPALRNAFDGFVYFSTISGHGQMVLDGDAIRLNTFANDAERRTCISLYTLAGSPIPIADQLDTIGTGAEFYRNEELLGLSKEGFVGKPLASDLHDAGNQTWLGQTADGDWIVGLFNRESVRETRSIDYASKLGLARPAPTRDLWTHADLGEKVGYDTVLAPHESRVLKIKAPRKRYEAEVAALSGGAKSGHDHPGHSAFGFVDGFGGAGAAIRFFVKSPAAGARGIVFRYANGGNIAKTMSLFIDGAKVGQVVLPPLPGWDRWASLEAPAALPVGTHAIELRVDAGDTGGINLDWIELK